MAAEVSAAFVPARLWHHRRPMSARFKIHDRPIGRGLTVRWLTAAILVSLAACVSTPPPKPPVAGSVAREGSRWVPVAWQELPGLHADKLQAA